MTKKEEMFKKTLLHRFTHMAIHGTPWGICYESVKCLQLASAMSSVPCTRALWLSGTWQPGLGGVVWPCGLFWPLKCEQRWWTSLQAEASRASGQFITCAYPFATRAADVLKRSCLVSLGPRVRTLWLRAAAGLGWACGLQYTCVALGHK